MRAQVEQRASYHRRAIPHVSSRHGRRRRRERHHVHDPCMSDDQTIRNCRSAEGRGNIDLPFPFPLPPPPVLFLLMISSSDISSWDPMAVESTSRSPALVPLTDQIGTTDMGNSPHSAVLYVY